MSPVAAWCAGIAAGAMDANVGRTDARIRWALAAALFVVALVFSGLRAIGLIAALLALLLAGTAATRVCPLWRLLGVNTSRPSARRPGGQTS